MHITCVTCTAGSTRPLVWPGVTCAGGVHMTDLRPLPALSVGTELREATGTASFRVTGRTVLPLSVHAFPFPLLTALVDMKEGHALILEPVRQGRALAWITLSDKGFAGQREDTSGPVIAAMVAEVMPLCHVQGFLLADSAPALTALIAELAMGQGYDIICTTGGTGLGPRDVSSEATLPLLDRRLHGFEQAMMAASLAKTPRAAISRAVAGSVGQCLCINLPGSRKAVAENLAAVLPALPHALDKLHGDPVDCGG